MKMLYNFPIIESQKIHRNKTIYSNKWVRINPPSYYGIANIYWEKIKYPGDLSVKKQDYTVFLGLYKRKHRKLWQLGKKD